MARCTLVTGKWRSTSKLGREVKLAMRSRVTQAGRATRVLLRMGAYARDGNRLVAVDPSRAESEGLRVLHLSRGSCARDKNNNTTVSCEMGNNHRAKELVVSTFELEDLYACSRKWKRLALD